MLLLFEIMAAILDTQARKLSSATFGNSAGSAEKCLHALLFFQGAHEIASGTRFTNHFTEIYQRFLSLCFVFMFMPFFSKGWVIFLIFVSQAFFDLFKETISKRFLVTIFVNSCAFSRVRKMRFT